ncbi:MAG: NUDIX hydrolase [Pseudomonadota bacterium]
MRRFGEAWRADAPYRERPGAYAVILDPRARREMLVAATPVDGERFLLPGGGIDPGESPLRALHREVLEETGYRIRPERRLGAFQRYCFMPEYGRWARKICHIYLCIAGPRLGPPIEPDHTPVWMPVETGARALSISGDRAFVAALAR